MFGQYFDTTNCPVRYGVIATLTSSDIEGGCLTRPVAFQSLLDQMAARSRSSKGETIRVGQAHDADEGLFERERAFPPLTWDDPWPLPFAWQGATTGHDAWGNTIDVERLTHQIGYQGAGSGFVVFDSSTTVAVVEHVDFVANSAHIAAYTTTSAHNDDAAILPTSGFRITTRYDTPPAHHDLCAHRSPLQGQTLVPGTHVPALMRCPTDTTAADWRVDAGGVREGYQTVDLVRVATIDDVLTAQRITYADGLAYPLASELWREDANGLITHQGKRLAGLRSAGRAMASAAPLSPAAAPADLQVIDARLGPAVGAAARSRFALALDEAAQAALDDRALAALHPTLADPSAILVTARYQSSSAPRWDLAFATPDDAAAVIVRCSGGAGRNGDVDSGLAAARCTDAPDDAARGLTMPDGIAAPPARGASFDLAVARADALYGPRDLNTASYSLADGGSLMVGYAEAAAEPVQAPPADEATTLALSDGRTMSAVQSATRTATLSDVPFAALAGPATPTAPGFAASDSAVIGASVAALVGLAAIVAFLVPALKASLWGLYARLTRQDVLDQETRARIVDLVAQDAGIHSSAIRQALSLGSGALEYHLRLLVREHVLTMVATTGFRRYFITGSMDVSRMRAVAALKEGRAEDLLRIIQDKPGILLGELAAEAEMAKSQASRTVKRLREAGVVESVTEGRAMALFARRRGDA